MIEHQISSPEKGAEDPAAQQQRQQPSDDRQDSDRHSVFGSIKSRLSRFFHSDSDPNRRGSGDTRHGTRRSQEIDNTGHSDSSSSISLPPRAQTPMLDPSTNIDPMSGSKKQDNPGEDGRRPSGAIKKNKPEGDVSKHTFYIVNSQMRLRLSARSEVWIHVYIKLPVADPAIIAPDAPMDHRPREECIFQPLHWSEQI